MHLLYNTFVPLKTSITVGLIMMLLLSWFSGELLNLMALAVILSFASIISWISHLTSESAGGSHSNSTIDNLKSGVLCFIFSEVMFFFGMFWCFFHTTMVVWSWDGALSSYSLMNPFGVPLLNTAILLNSGAVITCAHHELMRGGSPAKWLLTTSFLGVLFTTYQYLEYKMCVFSMSDGAVGSVFFICTGFHGAHVLVGTSGILMSVVNFLKNNWTTTRTCFFEGVVFYWHFVDVVWLFLYLFVYWWPFWSHEFMGSDSFSYLLFIGQQSLECEDCCP